VGLSGSSRHSAYHVLVDRVRRTCDDYACRETDEIPHYGRLIAGFEVETGGMARVKIMPCRDDGLCLNVFVSRRTRGADRIALSIPLGSRGRPVVDRIVFSSDVIDVAYDPYGCDECLSSRIVSSRLYLSIEEHEYPIGYDDVEREVIVRITVPQE